MAVDAVKTAKEECDKSVSHGGENQKTLYARVQSAHFSIMKVHSWQVVKCARSKCHRIDMAPMFVPTASGDATRLAVNGACVRGWDKQSNADLRLH
ncbi:hypothetical protein ACHAWX_002776 [Stephanocyclus meneghinianus]